MEPCNIILHHILLSRSPGTILLFYFNSSNELIYFEHLFVFYDFPLFQDWSDLIEYVINTFVKEPHTIQNMKGLNLHKASVDERTFSKLLMTQEVEVKKNEPVKHESKQSSVNNMTQEKSDK